MDNGTLLETLRAAVPLWIHGFRDLDDGERVRLGAECGQVIASQGDTLQFGGRFKFGPRGCVGGMSRVVLPRELSASEISAIDKVFPRGPKPRGLPML